MTDIGNILNKYGKYILIKLKKLNGTPYSIAAGFACGVAISFTPFIGFHLLLAALTALLCRGNILSSAIGTIIGNPWTFPFIWVAVLYTGRVFLGIDTHSGSVNFLSIFKSASDSLISLNFRNFGRDVWPIIFPMLVGCIPYYIVSWFISFKLIKNTLDKIHNRRIKRNLANAIKEGN